MPENDGGRAFPWRGYFTNRGETISEPDPGMSFLDWYAGQALIGLVASRPHKYDVPVRSWARELSEQAVVLARVMLEVRAEFEGKDL